MSITETVPGRRYESGRPRRGNSWAVVPLRLFLAAVFLFAGYAKLVYPGFFDPNSPTGLKASVDAAKTGTPIGAALGPLSDHPSLFGHITAFAEIAIGLGLLVGLLTRVAALGGVVLTAMIVLSINWGGVKQYTGSSGWFTSVDLAIAAGLSIFLLGGAGPLSLDWLISRARARHNARHDDEIGFRDSELEDSRRRLQGEPPSARWQDDQWQGSQRQDTQRSDGRTEQLPVVGRQDEAAGSSGGGTGATRRDQPVPESGSLWSESRRDSDQ